jgi:hypothetical protein
VLRVDLIHHVLEAHRSKFLDDRALLFERHTIDRAASLRSDAVDCARSVRGEDGVPYCRRVRRHNV